MNRILLLLFASITFLGFAQDDQRIEIKGKVIVDNNDLEGITVFNTSSNRGTITNENGQFTIRVKLNDQVEFAAIQFQNFTVAIDNDVIFTKQMTVYLVEQVNKLDEVLILPYNLTGNLDTDLASVRTFNPDLDALYFGIKNSDEYEFPDDNRSKVINRSMHSQSDPIIVNGLNINNVFSMLLVPLLRGDKPMLDPAKARKERKIDQLEDYYSIAFISTNFDIPADRVEEFIEFVEKKGIKERLLRSDNELELLQLMYSHRDEFLAEDD